MSELTDILDKLYEKVSEVIQETRSEVDDYVAEIEDANDALIAEKDTLQHKYSTLSKTLKELLGDL